MNRYRRLALVMAGSALIALSVAPAIHAQTERRAAEPMSYLGADWLERVERVDEERPDLVMAHLDLVPGQRVVDLGTGTGFYARRFARAVAPDGTVFAVDIQPEMLDIAAQLARDDGLTNFETVLSLPDDPKLPPDIDLLVLADVYHEIAQPQAVIEHIRNALAPDGRVALLEYRAEDATGDHIKSAHRMSVRQVLREWLPAGFRLRALHTDLPTQHLIILESAESELTQGAPRTLDLGEPELGSSVSITARGESDRVIRLDVANHSGAELVVTAPAGFAFEARARRSEMVLARDLLAVIPAGGRSESLVEAVPRRWDLDPPSNGDELALSANTPETIAVMQAVQAGMFQPGPQSARSYAPGTPEVARAALWLALEGAEWSDVRDQLGRERFPAAYAAAFGLALAAEGGVDPRQQPVWRVRGEIFSRIQIEELRLWLRHCCDRGER